MRLSPLPKYAVAAAIAIALLAGCAGGSSTSPFTGTGTGPQSSWSLPTTAQSLAGLPGFPAACPNGPKVWASSLGGRVVNGYTAANAAPCITLNGSTSGMAFTAPFGLATDGAGRLYVADVNNSRVVVFAKTGGYLATMKMASGEQPYNVCVSATGVVGVVDRPAASNGTGDVEFFTNYTNATMTGSAAGVLNTFEWCAFDKIGNFFADGSLLYGGGGGQKIVYLKKPNVNLPGKVMLDSGLGSATYWLGMYVLKGSSPPRLSVGGNYELQNFKIVAGVPTGPPTVTALPGYPTGSDAFYQAAPTTGGINATIYIADYGAGLVLQAPEGGAGLPGGPVSTYNPLSTTVGVATEPTGQY
jgi:hypothetical protein